MQQKVRPPTERRAAHDRGRGLFAVGRVIAVYRRRYGATTDYGIAWVTVALRDLRVSDDSWAGMDPAHRDAHPRL